MLFGVACKFFFFHFNINKGLFGVFYVK